MIFDDFYLISFLLTECSTFNIPLRSTIANHPRIMNLLTKNSAGKKSSGESIGDELDQGE